MNARDAFEQGIIISAKIGAEMSKFQQAKDRGDHKAAETAQGNLRQLKNRLNGFREVLGGTTAELKNLHMERE